MSEPILVVEQLRTHFQNPLGIAAAVDGVDLSMMAGRTLCLVGENRWGKSVTALSILRLLEANAITSGRILFRGSDLLRLSENELLPLRGGKIGMIFSRARHQPESCAKH